MKAKQEKKLNPKKQWAKFIIVTVLYLLFLYWVRSWWGLIVVPFIYDCYISKKIRWQWWQDLDGFWRGVMSWVDAIVFALVAVYFLNIFFIQNYVIPSSSLEKSLLVGDYLCVSKVSYGPRKPITPLTMPLTQHTMPITGSKSYIEWPQWSYDRVKGLGKVELNDIVVFNYPCGDTICNDPNYATQDYYQMAYALGSSIYMSQSAERVNTGNLNKQQQLDFLGEIFALGRRYLSQHSAEYGDITWRPVDRRENYVKRCVGLPGQTLQIKDRIIYLDGKPNKEPDNVQYSYYVKLKQYDMPEELRHELGISDEDDVQRKSSGTMPLTKRAAEELRKHTELVENVELNTTQTREQLYPMNSYTGWTRDNYGPIWIPAKGQTVELTMDNIAIYERPIRVYEGHRLDVKNSQIYIDGKLATSYTFNMDYYWMMGDNRHNSADSRYWGFVPEDHIVGKPIFVWWSSDPDRKGFSGIRWKRLFTLVDNIK